MKFVTLRASTVLLTILCIFFFSLILTIAVKNSISLVMAGQEQFYSSPHGLIDLGDSPLTDPIPERIQPDGTTVQFQTVATMPETGQSPRTRINYAYHSGDGSGRLFVNDLRGQLYAVDMNSGDVTLYLDIQPYFSEWNDNPGLNSGFSTFAFHPDFEENGKFYTIHTENPNGSPDYEHTVKDQVVLHGVLSEWTASDPSATTFSGSFRELLRASQRNDAHGPQHVQFNSNARPGDADYGMLYISIGDGEFNLEVDLLSDSGQDLSTPHGTILRIDPASSNSPNGRYGIPDDNPFMDNCGDQILCEIYAYGFRNPNRIAWDSGGERLMLISGIGQDNIEELNIVLPGRNYGWNKREGTFRFEPSNYEVVYPLPANDSDLGYTYPVAQYDHDDGWAIQGGFFYRGSLMPEMVGTYIFGDIVQGHLFYVEANNLILGQTATIHKLTLLNENGDEVDFVELVDDDNQRGDLRFGQDEDGEIYIMSKQDGVIRRLFDASRPNAPAPPTVESNPEPTVTHTSTYASVPTHTPSSTAIGTPTATVIPSPTETAAATTMPSATQHSTTPQPEATPASTFTFATISPTSAATHQTDPIDPVATQAAPSDTAVSEPVPTVATDISESSGEADATPTAQATISPQGQTENNIYLPINQ